MDNPNRITETKSNAFLVNHRIILFLFTTGIVASFDSEKKK